ncbi:MAG: hypothetical protein KDK41_12940 [Leptospiraceae bacterium]|nr:hypothetical protein [Leptospiraceae bacterium]
MNRKAVFIIALSSIYLAPAIIKLYAPKGKLREFFSLLAQEGDESDLTIRRQQIIRGRRLLDSHQEQNRDIPLSDHDPVLRNSDPYGPSLEPIERGSEELGFSLSPSRLAEYQLYEAERLNNEGPLDRGIDLNYGVVKLRIFGRTNVRASYGESFFLSSEDRIDDVTIANSNAIQRGFDLDMDMKVSIKGKIGQRVTVDIDFDRTERQAENTFQIQYKALRKREFVQEVTIGNIDLQLPRTEFAVFEQNSKQALGVQSRLERGKLKIKTIATLTQGQNHVDRFTGINRTSSSLIPEYRFALRRYYQLEPFLHYGDGCIPSQVFSAANYTRGDAAALGTLTSSNSGAQEFIPFTVDVTAGSLEIWMDDRDPRNDTQLGALTLQAISSRTTLNVPGNYHRLQEGKDYTFNPKTGRIRFVQFPRAEARIFARYQRPGGTCDPVAWSSGNIVETFLKWDRSLQEDSDFNGTLDVIIIDDGIMNLDVYEVRGVYELGAENILQTGFQISAVTRNYQTIQRFSDLGKYSIDYLSGAIVFFLREPFKNLKDPAGQYSLSDLSANTIYTDQQPSFVAENTEISLRADFTAEVRNYKLTHFNILRNSVTVRINNQLLDPSKYFIDYNSGFFTFIDPNDPVIGPSSQIEVAYEYSPFGASNQGYILGMRTDYEANRNLKLGSTVLFNGQFEPAVAPRPGQEPISRLLLEGDITLSLDDEKVTRLVNAIPGFDFDLLPVEITTYAEYARSFYDTNTFGLALIDDMESSEEYIDVEISDKDWILSSPPIRPDNPGVRFDACDRAPLYYQYYRDPNDIQRGLLELVAGSSASPPYERLSGPYNVAEGHLDPAQLNISQAERQVSIVMDFDFSQTGSANPFASAVTRNFSNTGRDFSNVSYLEFNARLLDPVALSSGVRIYFDVGTVWEDSDQDGNYDSEDFGLDNFNGDLNQNNIQDASENWDDGERNGVLDIERGGRSEDRGYAFNPPACGTAYLTRVGAGPDIPGFAGTRGNGVLDTEDLDRDGFINAETDENVVTIGNNTLTYLNFDQQTDNVLSSTDWTLFRVYIDPNLMNDNQRKAWRQVRSVRMYIVPETGSENGRGKVLIDGIRFGGSKWRQVRSLSTSGVENIVNDPLEFSVATIDNFSSKDEYRNESFLLNQRDVYESIHGKKTNTEYARIREAALKMTYDFSVSGTPNRSYTVRRAFLNTMDLRNYDSITLWVNYRDLPAQSSFLFRVGSSDTDYFEFASAINQSGWQSLKFNFGNPSRVSGIPNIKEINTMFVGVATNLTTSKGEIWVNDIYVTDPKVQTDDAWKYETSMQINKPLFETPGGNPVLSDIKMTYRTRKRGRQFASIGQSIMNVDENRTELIASTQILPFWKANYSYLNQSTLSDDNEVLANINDTGSNRSIDHFTEHRFKFENPHVPEIVAGYQYRNMVNLRKTGVAETDSLLRDSPRIQTIRTEEDTHSPNLLVQETLPEFFNTNVKYTFKSGIRFFDRTQLTETEAAEAFGLAATRVNTLEKEQTEETTNTLQIRNGNFSITPAYTYRQSLLVHKNYVDTINLEPINGDFYVPYFESPDDARYRQRITRYELDTAWQQLWIFSPALNVSATYQENSFQDNQLTFQRDKYQHLKQPSTLTTLRLSVPVDIPRVFPGFKYLRSFTPGFTREIVLNETAVPFTNRDSVYNDPLGLKRTLPHLAEKTFNIFTNPMWSNFLSPGRTSGNFAAGREYVQNTQLQPEVEPGYEAAFQNYDNALTLRENITLPAQWEIYEPLTLRSDLRLGQNAVRNNLTSLPVQSVNWGYSVLQTWNLMKVLDFWFWKEKARHSSTLDLNYTFDRNMRITENLREDRHTPGSILAFNWYGSDNTLSSISFHANLSIRIYDNENYLQPNGPLNDVLIYNTIPARAADGIREYEIGHDYSIEYRTEMPWLRKQLQNLTSLVLRYNPRYTARISANWNRYDYFLSQLLFRPTLDQYIFSQRFDINLHANVTGDFDLRTVWDVYRDPNTRAIRQEIISFQIGFGARILF